MLDKIAKIYILLINESRVKFGLKVVDLDYTVNEKNGTVSILIPDYYSDIEQGRKAFAAKVPIENLLKWMQKVGIPAQNSIAFAIQTSIYLNGILPKKGFLSVPLRSAEEPSLKILELNFSELLDKKIKSIK